MLESVQPDLSTSRAEAPPTDGWDAIVIGTGMGGATLGYRLAEAGQRVLFCESGASSLRKVETLCGQYPEMRFNGAVLDDRFAQELEAAGRNSQTVIDRSWSSARQFTPFIGSGTGGSSALYGMALERFFPSDFGPRQGFELGDGSSLAESWPVSYESLAPYYTSAEKLYRVRGTDDPLRAPREGSDKLRDSPPLTPGGAELFNFLQSRSVHPYRLPMACEFVAGCEGCQGYLCAKECKNDSARICLTPALLEHGARLMEGCEVIALETSARRISAVVCNWKGQQLRLQSNRVILAAGALNTPRILLNSKSKEWPAGIANGSGLVGRNLMRHFIDLYLIQAEAAKGGGFENRQKEVAFNDFYQHDGVKLGSVQSFGRLPPAPMMFASMKKDIKDGALGWMSPVFPAARPFLMPFLNRLVHSTTTLATTIEDLPYLDNRVAPGDPSSTGDRGIAVHYKLHDEARRRVKHMRALMADLLANRRWRRVEQAENNQRIAHACGTCRFGLNPKSSVLNEYNRAHEVDNLYVVDSSFFPSSGGTNPSLTIAANALRVADHLI